MTIHIGITISITSLKRFCRRKYILLAATPAVLVTLRFALTESVNNCYHVPENGHYAEKVNDDSWDKKGLLCGTMYQECKLKSTLHK